MIKIIFMSIGGLVCLSYLGCADNCSPVASDGTYICEEEEYGYEDDYPDENDQTREIDEDDVDLVVDIVRAIATWALSDNDDYEDKHSEKKHDPCSNYTAPITCNSDSEALSKVELRIGSPSGVKPARVTLFAGFHPSSHVLKTFENPLSNLSVLTNERSVSAEAVYVIGKDTVTVVEGTKIRVRQSNTCGVRCYEAESARLDLTLAD